MQLAGASLVLGTCAPSANVATVPSVSAATMGVGCQADSAGSCSTGTCAPQPSTPFLSKICVWKTGPASSCPAGFLDVHSYNTVTDTRACTTCQCGTMQATCVSWTFTLNVADGGTGQLSASDCVPTEGLDASCPYSVPRLSGPAIASCPFVDGGVPTGSVTTGDTITVCCSTQ
jgi:hypothetical protein